MPKLLQQNILLVQHGDRERQSLWAILQRNGIAAVAIDSGAQALNLLEQDPFSVVLIIDQLEDMPAQELCLLIKDTYPEIKVIIVSTEYTSEEQDLYKEAGVDGHFPNTHDRNLLIKALQQMSK